MPKGMTQFFEYHVDNIVSHFKFDPSCLWSYEKRLGGYIIKFRDSVTAKRFESNFPADVQIGGKVFHVVVGQIPTMHQGVRVRVVGLPTPTTPERLREIAELLAMDPSDVVFVDILKSKLGVPTEKGFIIYRVAPVSLLLHSSLMYHGHKLTFYWMDRDISCQHCSSRGHHQDACPSRHYKALPFRKDRQEEDTLEKKKSSEDEEEEDSAEESDVPLKLKKKSNSKSKDPKKKDKGDEATPKGDKETPKEKRTSKKG
jgi:hypothetical protein